MKLGMTGELPPRKWYPTWSLKDDLDVSEEREGEALQPTKTAYAKALW